MSYPIIRVSGNSVHVFQLGTIRRVVAPHFEWIYTKKNKVVAGASPMVERDALYRRATELADYLLRQGIPSGVTVETGLQKFALRLEILLRKEYPDATDHDVRTVIDYVVDHLRQRQIILVEEQQRKAPRLRFNLLGRKPRWTSEWERTKGLWRERKGWRRPVAASAAFGWSATRRGYQSSRAYLEKKRLERATKTYKKVLEPELNKEINEFNAFVDWASEELSRLDDDIQAIDDLDLQQRLKIRVAQIIEEIEKTEQQLKRRQGRLGGLGTPDRR